jgi:uncharacterized protein (DUF58 family)
MPTDAPCPPDVLAGIADLELAARIVVEGLVSGLHRSPFHGYSAEFSQYRRYRPGDDLKYVDWKLLARTDRVYTKQFRETTNTAASIVIDTSASMDFLAGQVTKFRYAVVIAAALAYVIAGQGDAAGLVARDAFLPPRGGRQHLRRLLALLGSLAPGGVWSGAEIVRRAADRLGRRGLLIVVSDFYDDEERMASELRRAQRMGHDVVQFQVLTRDEIALPYGRDVEFADLESGARLPVNPVLARRDYRDAVAEFLERMRSRALAEGRQHTLVVTDTPPERVLRSFLLARHA